MNKEQLHKEAMEVMRKEQMMEVPREALLDLINDQDTVIVEQAEELERLEEGMVNIINHVESYGKLGHTSDTEHWLQECQNTAKQALKEQS